jgi:hypothetical protein
LNQWNGKGDDEMLTLEELIKHISAGCDVEVCNELGVTHIILPLTALENVTHYMSDQLLDSEVLTINCSNVNRLRVNVSMHEEVIE